LQRAASGGRISSDGRWIASVHRDATGILVASRDGSSLRELATELVDVACMTWLPESRSVLVHARAGQAVEPDWWVVPIDGGSPTNLRLVARLFRDAGLFTVPSAVAWMDGSLFFSAAGPQGIGLFRQRMFASTFEPAGMPERLTTGSESPSLPTAAAGRVAFVSSQADTNLWSVSLDASGVGRGPLRRLTRGPGILGYLSASEDFGTLAYFSFRLGMGAVFLRDLRTGAERNLAEGPAGEKSYPALSPSGDLLAYGTRMPGGESAQRPIFVVNLADGTWRKLGDDCGGRPREWVDERTLVIERFARFNSVALIDTGTVGQQELLQSGDRSIRNPRLSPDRRWIAFDASRPGEQTAVMVAPFRPETIPESEWVLVDRAASHPFWSTDGRLLYYMPTGTNPLIRSAVRARRFGASGLLEGESIAVYASTEMSMPGYLPGTAPIATPDEIILVLGDFRGDIWIMDVAQSKQVSV
jgi:Tol biopolymer transport system component